MSGKSKSELLNESIVDATELKRAALVNAQQLLLKTYGPRIEEYVERVLEEQNGEDEKNLLLGEAMPPSPPTAPSPMGDNSGGMPPAPDLQLGDQGAETPMDMPGMAPPEQNQSPTGEKDVEPSESAQNAVDQNQLASVSDENQKVVITLGAVSSNPKKNEEGKDMTEQKPLAPASGEPEQLTAPVGEGSVESDEDDEEVDLNLEEIKKMLEETIVTDTADSHQGSVFTNKEEAESDNNKRELKEKVLGESEVEGCLGNQKDVTKVYNDNSKEKDKKETVVETVKVALKESVRYFDKKIKDLNDKNKFLSKQNTIYKETIVELKETLEKANLLNTRLYYKNQVLRDPSLNERQKVSIAEAISKAESREKVKTIFEVRQSFLGNVAEKKEKTLEQILEARNYLQTFKRGSKELDNGDEIEKRVQKRLRVLAGIEKDDD